MTHPVVRERFASLAPRPQDTRSSVERLLSALGVDPALAEAVLGDMAEERANRAAADGTQAARRWYIREFIRSLPSLAWSAVRHLSPEGRLRLAAWMVGGAFAAGSGAFLLSLRTGPPARLVAENSALAGGVVVNHARGQVQLPLRVLDKAGRSLPTTDVRYGWVSGVPVMVSPDGALACLGTGDAVVRASLGVIATDVRILCRPVSSLMVEHRFGVVLGGPRRGVAFLARDAARQPVTTLSGALTIRDTSIAALDATQGRYRVRARAAGSTYLDVMIGDVRRSTRVTVYAPVPTLEGLQPDQKRVAVAARLTPGETRRWRVARGTYSIQILPGRDSLPIPRLAVVGANCLPGDEQWATCASASDFWVIAYSPLEVVPTQTRAGYVALGRHE